MKAIEKEVERRYQTANALANDVQRYLAGEPVVAAPPSTVYRLRKFVTRHRGPVIAAAMVVLALVGGFAGTLWQSRVPPPSATSREAARATALNQFMTQMLTASNPEALGARDVTVAEVLVQASKSAGDTLRNEPQAEAEARTLLGETFRALGKTDEAEVELERAVELLEQGDGEDPMGYSRALRGLGLVHREQWRARRVPLVLREGERPADGRRRGGDRGTDTARVRARSGADPSFALRRGRAAPRCRRPPHRDSLETTS